MERKEEGGGGPPSSPSSRSAEVTQVKQYLVMKMVEGIDKMAGLMALPGFYTFEAAQQFVSHARAKEPGASYFIQEVGAA